tara:strand:- start:877 stop:2514 length:1638 start_codon:yes stop_codon:yes gene_type:complete
MTPDLKNKIIIFTFFFSYFLIGVFTFKDYGVNIEEQTQLYSGFYWLNYIVNFFNLGEIKPIVNDYFLYLKKDTLIPSPEIYGPIFDVPTAFIDIFFNLNKEVYNYTYRHLIIFIIFFSSSIIIFKVLFKRYHSIFLSLFGTSLYIFSPRIYGDSFHNNKDILFLSLVVFSTYFIFKIFEKKKLIDLFLFSLFSALATSTRVMGIFLPISLLLFLVLENKKDNLRVNIKYIILIILSYFALLYLHWPYLWENPIDNFFNFILKSKEWIYSYNILFNGKYYLTTNLPDSFIFVWIGISTPIINIILFLFGYFFILRRVFKRFILIDLTKNFNNDFWRGINEKKDLYIFFSLTSIILILVFLNVSLVSGWRHLYFLNFYIVYIATFFVKIFLLNFKGKDLVKVYFFLFVMLYPAITKIIELHPFQSLYFNELLNDNKKNQFLIDRDGITSLDSFNKILEIEKKNQINLANASFVPYYRISKALELKAQNRFNFTGTDFSKAEYIFNNFVYEVDPKYNDKYKIPDNFELIYSLELDGIKMYELYKKYNN